VFLRWLDLILIIILAVFVVVGGPGCTSLWLECHWWYEWPGWTISVHWTV